MYADIELASKTETNKQINQQTELNREWKRMNSEEVENEKEADEEKKLKRN